jgi:hypothetical protein
MRSDRKVADTLLRFARARERAYQSVGSLRGAVLQAIRHIKAVAEYFSTVPDSKQLRAIPQIESDLMLILPGENSRFRKQRDEILTLIQLSHERG